MSEQKSATVERFAVVGDIHGCAKTLHSMLEQLKPFSERVFVFLGDYIDRGPDSKSVLDQLIAFSASHRCVFIRGNHEQMALDAINTPEKMRYWLGMGGKTTIASYGFRTYNVELPYAHHHFLRNTKLFHEAGDYVFVHGGMDPEMSINGQLSDPNFHQDFLWERAHLKYDTHEWEKTVVFGHTPVPEPIDLPGKIGIDTGCVYPRLPRLGRLCSVILPEKSFVYQPCLDEPQPY